MARIPLAVVSVASAVVLFVGTSAALLAFEGRLGSLLGGPPAPGPGAESRKAGDAAKGEHKESPDTTRTEHQDSASPKIAGEKPGNETHKSAEKGREKPSAMAIYDGASSRPAAPKRVATASLVQHFQIPQPFTAKELEELVSAMREGIDADEKLKAELNSAKAANERDRLDLEARFAEIDDTRKKLDEQKAELTAKVTDLARRSEQLSSGEDKFVKATVARLATLKTDEARTQLLILDDALAARVLNKMEPKACAKMLASLPAEKMVALTKQLRALSLAESEALDTKGAGETNK
jgi:flagellar motility protein MotE (MotC chaperone)